MKSISDQLEKRIEAAVKNPQNLGEMENADAIGTVGSPDCGDMLRMWVKFKEEGGRKVIDRATFQTFGCQTAIAVASVATEMLAGKTIAEAQSMTGEELAAPLGALLFTQAFMQHILANWSRTDLLVIYDHQGTRSMDAAAYFQGHGFEHVKSLRGGIDAYSAEVDPKLPRYNLEQT